MEKFNHLSKVDIHSRVSESGLEPTLSGSRASIFQPLVSIVSSPRHETKMQGFEVAVMTQGC